MARIGKLGVRRQLGRITPFCSEKHFPIPLVYDDNCRYPANELEFASIDFGHHCSERVVGITGQSLPDSLRRRGESLKTTHDHSAQ